MERQEDTRSFSVVLETSSGLVTVNPSDIIQFYFIEDIFSMSMVGKIIMKDNRGLLEFGPLTGNEKIGVIYGEENDIEKEFKIYSVSKIDKMENIDPSGKNVMEIFFADPMFFPINFLQFSKSWANKRISDIVKDIAENILGVSVWDKFEDTHERLETFYTPYWNMGTAIKWLSKRASGISTKNTGYCFYNTPSGTNFFPLNSMLENTKLLKISDEDDGLYTFEDSNLYLYNKILNWSMMGIDNSSLRSIAGGVRFGFDTYGKRFIKNEYEYSSVVKNHTILGNKTLFPDISNSNSIHALTGESDEKTINNMYNDYWIKKYSLQQCLSLTVRGHERRKCGELIEIFWPSKWVEENYNKNMHGKYLIKSITHMFCSHNSPVYSQKLVCIKNGYEESQVKDLVNSVKKNVS